MSDALIPAWIALTGVVFSVAVTGAIGLLMDSRRRKDEKERRAEGVLAQAAARSHERDLAEDQRLFDKRAEAFERLICVLADLAVELPRSGRVGVDVRNGLASASTIASLYAPDSVVLSLRQLHGEMRAFDGEGSTDQATLASFGQAADRLSGELRAAISVRRDG